jgi:hypothetical protein
LTVGVDPELLEPPLLVVLALPPPLPPLELDFELEPPHAATANAVIATSSSAANGRTNLFKLILLQEGWSPSEGAYSQASADTSSAPQYLTNPQHRAERMRNETLRSE